MLKTANAVVPLYDDAAAAFTELAHMPGRKLTVIPNAVAKELSQ